MQVNDSLADFEIIFGTFSRNNIHSNPGEQPSFFRLQEKVPCNVNAGDIIGHNSLDCTHGPTRLRQAFGHGL